MSEKITFAGRRFWHEGAGRFRFPSLSDPTVHYVVDLHEAPYCTCWAMKKLPAYPCHHLLVVRQYLKKLKTKEQP